MSKKTPLPVGGYLKAIASSVSHLVRLVKLSLIMYKHEHPQSHNLRQPNVLAQR